MSELETVRLRLRPLRRSDLDALTGIYLDPEVARHLIARPQTREDVSRHLDDMLERAKHFGLWAIELKETGELIGRAGFYGYTLGGSLEPELAFLLRRDCWQHVVSRHVLEKLGMREVGSVEMRGMSVLVYALAR